MSKVDVSAGISTAASSIKASESATAIEPVIKSVVYGDEEWYINPEFIYGGPFITIEKPSPFLNIATPVNGQLQGTFKQSYPYFSLKDRFPIILTKIIDHLARDKDSIKLSQNATDDDIRGYIEYITKLKNDLVTNKPYDLLTVDTPEAKKWNTYLLNSDIKLYFMNTWVFTECYVYRRLREGCELSKGLANFDPFQTQKQQSFTENLEVMCIVASKVVAMLPESEKDKRKADLVTLLKICLWSNKCDLSLSMGEQVAMKKSPSTVFDPLQMIIDRKDKIVADDSIKFADQLFAKAQTLSDKIANTTLKVKCSCNRLATLAGIPLCKPPSAEKVAEGGEDAEGAEGAAVVEGGADPDLPKPPCPAKLTVPQTVIFDIVCDNAGYELFTDLCVAHFLVSQNVVKKVRFHVKNMPWFISDVTPNDFKYLINTACTVEYSRKVETPLSEEANKKEGGSPDAPPAEGEATKGGAAEEPEPIVINSDDLQTLAKTWNQYVEDGTFILMADDFWTSPHAYKDMKKYDPFLYRKLQYAVAIMFKGDLNYRKLLADRNVNTTTRLEPNLQGFLPSMILAVRTIKSEIVCGMGKAKADLIKKVDPKWMLSGEYGVIQFSGKAEALGRWERPCEFYGAECRGHVCPPITHM